VEFRILGPLEVRDKGRELELGGAKQRAVLALLLLHANEVVALDRLIDGIWGERPPDTATAAVHRSVSRLRKVLEPNGAPYQVIRTQSPGYVFAAGPEAVDRYRFERLAAEGKTALDEGDAARSADLLREALVLWRGPALADIAFTIADRTELDRLEKEWLSAVEARIEADLALGRHALLVPELEALVAAHPLRERLRGQLMLAFYRSGRQAEALAAYQVARQQLLDELGLEPGEALQRLEKAILVQDASLEPAAPLLDVVTAELPRGTVTFLFTDIEGSTRLLKELGDGYGEVLAQHQRILREAAEAREGREIDTQGDSFFFAFSRANAAVGAAVTAQRALNGHRWPEGCEPRVRMGLHTSEPRVGSERYVGLGVHRAARIGAAAHGGQVLLSSATRELVDEEVSGVAVRELGSYRLKDFDDPERLSQLDIEGLQTEFPPLNAERLARPRSTRARLAFASAGLALCILGVLALVAMLGDETPAVDRVRPNGVGAIDPASNTLVQSTPVGAYPQDLVVDGESVWVANAGNHTVSGIDTRTGQVTSTGGFTGAPVALNVSRGVVWIAMSHVGQPTSILRLSTVPNEVAYSVVELAKGPGLLVPVLASGPSGLWASLRAEPDTFVLSPDGAIHRLDVLPDLCTPVGSGIADATVWIGCDDGRVVRVDEETRRPVATTDLGTFLSDLAVGAGAVWATDTDENVVWRIDAATGRATRTIPVGERPSAPPSTDPTKRAHGIAIGLGSVWVASRNSGTVSRIDPESNRVVATIRVGRDVAPIAVGDGRVWVARQGVVPPH
jgi:YVTN family beta-propeller protein